MIPPPTLRLSSIILSITLTVILISSPIIAAFSHFLLPSTTLEVQFAAATSSENNEDEEQANTDATGEEDEVVDDDNAQEEEQDQDGEEAQEQEGFASIVGEICDDFEDNDGDGLIDLADTDCATGPATQGTVTAPTTPQAPTSVVNTTATNSTANTLTASGIAGLDRPYDLEKDCKTLEEQGIPPPPPEPGDPPNVKWYDCPPGVLVRDPPRADTTTTTTNSAVEICDDFEDNDGDGLIDLADTDCATGPATQGTVTAPTTPQAPTSVVNTTATNSTGNTLTASGTTSPDEGNSGSTTPEKKGLKFRNLPDNPNNPNEVTIQYPNGPKITTEKDKHRVSATFPDGTWILRDPEGQSFVQLPYPTGAGVNFPERITITHTPDGTTYIEYPFGASYSFIIINPDNTVVATKGDEETTYSPQGSSITQDSDGRVIEFNNPNDASITSFRGTVTIQFLNGPEVTTEKGKPSAHIRFDDGPQITTFKHGVMLSVPYPGTTDNLYVSFHSDGTIAKGGGGGDWNVIRPDKTVNTQKRDGTVANYNPDVP